MFTAYCDESGHPSDSHIFTLAAVVAPTRQWIKFEEKWKRTLRRYRVSMFHMTDYENRQGEFMGWDQDRRISFIAELASIIKNTMLYAVANSVVVKDWNEIIMPLFPRFKYMGPHIFLFHDLILSITESVKLPEHESIACVFDENNLVRHSASIYYQCLRIVYHLEDVLTSITFTNKRLIAPLQAADMVAYEAFKYTNLWEDHGLGRPRRKLLSNLSATESITLKRASRIDLLEFRDKAKVFLEYVEKEGLQPGAAKYLQHYPTTSGHEDDFETE